ncbi:Hypothetical predicted protein [Lecanosticta acicola]|uniref:Uncharacterized protein n=1 Tax=Lecanosticta acicola TaxID=111012 RepID=A0AAI8YTE4_9PEZI|nr:Hypothetical predicted protein [Lecanosticta acicola]
MDPVSISTTAVPFDDAPSRLHSSADSESSLYLSGLGDNFCDGSALFSVLSSYEDHMEEISEKRDTTQLTEILTSQTLRTKPSRNKMLGIPSPLPHSRSRWHPSEASRGIEPLPSEIAKVVLKEWDARNWHQSSDALTSWLNSRWRKTGYQVSPQTVCWTLKAAGRDAQMGLGDPEDGAFLRGPSSEDLLSRPQSRMRR